MKKSRLKTQHFLCVRDKKTNGHWLFKSAIILLLAIFNISQVSAQSKMISGTVNDASGISLPGVTIAIKGTTQGTITDVDGQFSLEVSPENTLIFSFVGYNEQEVLVGDQTTFNITLEEEAIDMDEVVVVGYGVQRKSVVTAAIGSVKGEELEKVSNGRVESALQGRTAGVAVMPTSGAPGAGVKIRIRGTGSNGSSNPLYIVDGMKTGGIDDLDPNDIESMEVLKDAASAAIYGTEGANGVVMITTKSGKKGTTQVSYNFQYGIQNLSTNAEMMNAAEYSQFMSEAGETVTPPAGENYDTDWLDAISTAAPMQRHSLSFSGGSEKSTYLMSGSFLRQDGAIGGEDARFERYTFRINTKSEMKPWLEVGNNLNFSHSSRNVLPEDDEYRSIVNSALLMDPYTPIIESDMSRIDAIYAGGNTPLQNGSGQYYGLNRFVTGETANPVAFMENTHDKQITDKLLASFYGTLKPLKGLSITSRIGLELTYVTQKAWSPKYYFSSERSNNTNIVEDWSDKYYKALWENFASYNKKFGDHDFTGLIGMSFEDYTHPNYYLKSQMPKEGSQYAYHDFSVEKTTNRVGGTLEESSLVSYFGRLSYNYKAKYMVEASLRRDGASVLPKDNRWNSFAAISGGWVISQEDFWGVDAIDYLKLRASWGENGSIANVIPFADREFWTSEGIMYPNEDETLAQGSRVDSPINPDLLWEKSDQTNVGVDLRAFASRFSFSMDYYKKSTEGLIKTLTLPGSYGNYNSPSANLGTVENSGFEFEMGWRNTTSFGLKYSVNLNLSTLKNEVTQVLDDTPQPGANVRGYDMTWFEQGQPIWYFKGYKTNGINPETGEPNVVDVSGDGEITAADQTYIGDPHPDLLYGATINLEYKNFDFSMFMQGMSGNDVFMAWFRTDRKMTNKPKFFFDDRWTPGNTGASMPKPNNESDYLYRSDLVVQDASYMRIKQLQLGYTIPTNLVSSIGLSRVRAFISLDDYFTFTKYKGMDPEAGSGDDNRQGIDKGLYPTTKKFMFGLSVNF
ncbi:SusC/RagA family TonB-linked outer membrane protein [Carboxylicivirga sp. N1Y90]|uniref:SusC/RagA family TonB-linked outer membrane protein n=1 Tax=Carboxylicivirga fragile TaxID=3417571 RepID=UPI003D34E6F9|nr:TonB-dependent receptor [Marinilabiliaceae bacterium N1Y90]